MRINSDNFNSLNDSKNKELHLVVKIAFDDTTDVYFTSHADITIAGETVVSNVLVKTSSTSQRINPNEARATIGSINFDLVDYQNAVTDVFRSALQTDDNGLRGKTVELYLGYAGLAWADFRLEQTQVIDKAVTYKDGAYNVQCRDIQREVRKQIFEVTKTRLAADVAIGDTTISVFDTTGFELIPHGSSYTIDPDVSIMYFKIKAGDGFEICSATGSAATEFTGVTRGLFGTKELTHTVGEDESSSPEITEYIFLEMPAIKMAYACLTGKLIGQGADVFPDHYFTGVPDTWVDVDAFTGIGVDLYDSTDDQLGLVTRFEGLTKTDGKRFIEQQLLLLAGCVMPILPNGKLSLKKVGSVLTGSSYVAELNASNVVKYSGLKYDLSAIKNQLDINWSWLELQNGEKDFYRINRIIDQDSIDRFGATIAKPLKFYGLHGNRHTQSTINKMFDVFRDRVAGASANLTVDVLPSTGNNLEVGDIVLVKISALRDHTGLATLDRAFEIQSIKINQLSQSVSLTLFGSTQQAGLLTSGSVPPELPDEWYCDESFTIMTDLSTILTIDGSGIVTADGTITGDNRTGNVDPPPPLLYEGITYTGNGTAQTISHSLPVVTDGGVVWVKCRNNNRNYVSMDTDSGIPNFRQIQDGGQLFSDATRITALTDTSFSVGTNNEVNFNTDSFVAWLFRKNSNFLNIVNWTGTGLPRSIAHGLTSDVGLIMVFPDAAGSAIQCLHKDMAANEFLSLQANTGTQTDATIWNNTLPDATSFWVSNGYCNQSGIDYTAYVFAHDPTGNIYCGTYNGTGVADQSVNIGWTPDFILVKSYGTSFTDPNSWVIMDTARGVGAQLHPDINTSESTSAYITLTATGFDITTSADEMNQSGVKFIYMAIREGEAAQVPVGVVTHENAIYYHEGDLTIPTGRIIDWTGNIQLRVRGHLTINGTLTGKGAGFTSNTPGYIGNTQATGGIEADLLPGYRVAKSTYNAPIYGLHSEFPPLTIVNNGGVISGWPSDLRGTGGDVGGFNRYVPDGDEPSITAGGGNGAGGGGIVLVTRGGSFGASGTLVTSGDDGLPGALDINNFAYSGSGSGGSPGAVLWLFDGTGSTRPITLNNVIQERGDISDQGIRLEIDIQSNVANGHSFFEGFGAGSVDALKVDFIPPTISTYPIFICGVPAADDLDDAINTGAPAWYWKLDETSGTTAADTMGNNNLTYNVNANTPGYNVASSRFDGAGSAKKIDTGVVNNIDRAIYSANELIGHPTGSDFTIEFAFNLSSLDTTMTAFASNGGVAGLHVNISGTLGIQCSMLDSTSTVAACSTDDTLATLGITTDEAWHWISCRMDYSGNLFDILLDGVQVATKTSLLGNGIPSLANTGYGTSIGAYHQGGLLYAPWGGSIDEVAMYQRAISDGERTNNYNWWASNTGNVTPSIAVSPTIINESKANGAQTTASVTATATNFIPVTWAWTTLAGATTIVADTPTVATTTFTSTGDDITNISDFLITGTDVNGFSATQTIRVAVQHGLALNILPSPLTESVANGTVTTASVTATPTNMIGAITYLWRRVSGSTQLTIDTPTAASTTFESTGTSQVRTAQFICTATDANGDITADFVTVTVTHS